MHDPLRQREHALFAAQHLLHLDDARRVRLQNAAARLCRHGAHQLVHAQLGGRRSGDHSAE